MHSNPVFVSRYCTCMRPSTRLMSVWMTLGDFVEVVATLIKRQRHQASDELGHAYLNSPLR